MTLSLALAIRDALPPGGGPGAATLAVRTFSVTVGDEVTPADHDADIVYQTRDKSAVEVTVEVAGGLAEAGLAWPVAGGKKGPRGAGGRGRGRGGRGGRGRGRGR